MPPPCSPLEQAKRRLVRQFAPLQILVFGSHARQTAHAGSDLDLLVVLPDGHDRRAAAIAMRRSLRDLPVAKDIVIATPADLAQPIGGTVVEAALREGRTVYRKRTVHAE